MLEIRLAGAAEPHLVKWNPQIDVFAAVLSNKRAVLCRYGGEQVWQAPLRRVSTPIACNWTPDGRLFTVVFADGKTQTLSETMGRQALTSRNDSEVSCLAWGQEPDTETTAQKAVDHEEAFDALQNDITKLMPRLPSTDTPTSALILMGTQKGALRINLYSSVSLDDLPIDPEAKNPNPVKHCMVTSDELHYAALVNTTLYQWTAGYVKTFGPEGMQARVLAAAYASSLAAEVVRGRSKLQDVLKQLYTAHDNYFGEAAADPEDVYPGMGGIPEAALLQSLVAGHCAHGVDEWLENEHESGLRNWVSATELAYSSIERLHTELIIPATQHLALHLGRMEGLAFNQSKQALWDTNVLAELNQRVHGLLSLVHEEQRTMSQEAVQCYALAHFLQSKLTKRLDRKISLATRGSLDIYDATTYVRKCLKSSVHEGVSSIDKQYSDFEKSLASAGAGARGALRNMVRLDWKLELPCREVLDMVMDDGCTYKLLLLADDGQSIEYARVEDAKIISIDKLGLAAECKLTPSGDQVVMLLPSKDVVNIWSYKTKTIVHTTKVHKNCQSLAVGLHWGSVLTPDCQTALVFAIGELPALARAIADPQPLERELELSGLSG